MDNVSVVVLDRDLGTGCINIQRGISLADSWYLRHVIMKRNSRNIL